MEHYGCVWIELIFAETENWNWKYCSEIIFKCVNSVVGPIFNKKVAEKCNLWDHEQYTDALFTVDKVNYCGWTKKRKKKRREKRSSKNVDAEIIWIQTVTMFFWILEIINDLCYMKSCNNFVLMDNIKKSMRISFIILLRDLVLIIYIYIFSWLKIFIFKVIIEIERVL